MWVSTSPWQCGKYVAYDLNRIFSDSIDFNHEIYTGDLTLPADSFLQQQEYQQTDGLQKTGSCTTETD